MAVLGHLSCCQPLGQRAQVGGRNLHNLVRSRGRIKDALLLDVHSPRPACMTHGVTAGVPEASFLAGFDAHA